MAKQRAPLEFNSIAGGIITEASALTFPDSASLDESNFELNKDGTRKRRLGFEQEVGGEFYTLPNVYSSINPDTVNSFLWSNVGGRPSTELTVVQVGEEIHFYEASLSSLSAGKTNLVVTITHPSGEAAGLFSFASIDGDLVVATGLQEITIIEPIFGSSGLITSFNVPAQDDAPRLTIRDLFGIQVMYNRAVEDEASTSDDYIDITLPEYITKRPMAAGLPNQESLIGGTQIQSSATAHYTSFTSTGGSHSLSYRVEKDTASTYTGHTFSPSTLYGHRVLEMTTATTTPTTYDGVPVGPSTTSHIIVFATAPEFSGFSLHGGTYTFTKQEGSGNVFEGNGLGIVVPNPLVLTITVDEATLSSTLYNYNLRNQTFGAKRLTKTGTSAADPVDSFVFLADNVDERLPSMSDTVLSALYPNIDAANKTADRFHAEDLLENPVGSAPAPKGYFIIDALARSNSRYERWKEAAEDQGYQDEVVDISETNADYTPGGPKSVAEYSGRLWYGGFSEEGTNTEAGGMRLESYLLYSQLANSKAVLTRCYQQGDPTSVEAPELLDTDGGFISLDGAYGVSSLIPLGNSLLAFCANGVWAVSGFDGNYFSPTSPRVQLVTSKGSISPRAIVVIDSVVMYWSRDGIYVITQGELGAYKVESLTEKTIQTLYTDIPLDVRAKAFGEYDAFTSKVSWFIYNTTARDKPTQVISLLTTTGAFTTHTISHGTRDRTLVGPAEVSPFILGEAILDVVVGDLQVVVGLDVVTSPVTSAVARTLSVKGIFLERAESGGSLLSFGEFSNTDFADWGEVDAPAYIVTGYVSGGDFQRDKQVPYITMHFDRTEDGFYADVGGDLFPLHESSCKLQAQWDWADSVNSGRWSRETQAYRYPRLYSASGVDDPYDTGFSTITTKNKIRGKGRVLSLKLSTEEGKDCRILGWSAMMGVNNNV